MGDNIKVNPSTAGTGVDTATNEIGGVHHPKFLMEYGEEGSATRVSRTSPMPVGDPWLHHAIAVILSDYSDTVSIHSKNKDLLKFGRNDLVGATEATVMTLPAGILHETYVSSNLITTVSSSSASDTEQIVVEGHTTTDGLSFTFATQTLTLTGQTQFTLATPLARISRAYNDNGTYLVGDIYFYEDNTTTAGVPDTGALVHMMIDAGEQQSEKAATTMSSTDYWIVTSYYGDMLKKTAGFAEVNLELRLAGKVFRHKISVSCSDGSRGFHQFQPYFICPKNADIRLVSTASASATPISGGIQGVLAEVV